MPTDYRLVKIVPFTDEEWTTVDYGDGRGRRKRDPCDYDYFAGTSGRPPTSARIVPPPPDYSTPAAVTARCYESGGWGNFATGVKRVGQWWNKDTPSFRKVLKAFRAVVPALPCRVEDSHVSRWRVVPSGNAAPLGWTLTDVPLPVVKKRARKARSAVPV